MRAALALAGCILATSSLHGQEPYDIRPASANRLFLLVEKTGLLAGKRHHLSFRRYSGTLAYDPAHSDRSSVRIDIEANTLVVEDDWVKEKDRVKIHDFTLGSEMLDAARFPALSFRSDHVSVSGDNRFRATGLLSIAGKSQAIEVTGSLKTADRNLLLDGESTFRLSSFGLKRPSAALGAVGTKDEVVASFHLFAQPASLNAPVSK